MGLAHAVNAGEGFLHDVFDEACVAMVAACNGADENGGLLQQHGVFPLLSGLCGQHQSLPAVGLGFIFRI
jgi:hypothetical protein